MSNFDARLRLAGESRLPLGVEVDVTSDRVTVSAGNRTVATWVRSKLAVEPQADGFHITVDGEEVILNVTDSTRFAAALGVPAFARPAVSNGGPSSVRAQIVSAPTQRETEVKSNGGPLPSLNGGSNDPEEGDYYSGRIAEVVAALRSDSVTAAQAFAKWVRLLKEINLRHGQGSMPTDHFFRLNTEILDLIPEPKPSSSAT